MIIFLRENVIENKTVTVYKDPDNIATNYYLNLCLE